MHHLYDSSGGDSEEEEREQEKIRCALNELQDYDKVSEEIACKRYLSCIH